MAHKGEFLVVDNVKLKQVEESWVYHFNLVNVKQAALRGVTIELLVNGKSILQLTYPIIRAGQKAKSAFFEVAVSELDPYKDQVQIEVTTLFGVKGDWGGWDSLIFKSR